LQSSKKLWRLYIHLYLATINIKRSFKNDKYHNLTNIHYLLKINIIKIHYQTSCIYGICGNILPLFSFIHNILLRTRYMKSNYITLLVPFIYNIISIQNLKLFPIYLAISKWGCSGNYRGIRMWFKKKKHSRTKKNDI
jgi:hypothetical protein